MAFMNFLKKSKKKEEIPKKTVLDAPPPPPIPEISREQTKPIPESEKEKMQAPLIEPHEPSIPPTEPEPIEIPKPKEKKEVSVPPEHEIISPPETLHGYPPVHEPEIKMPEPEMEPPPSPPKKVHVEKPMPKVDVFRKEYSEALLERKKSKPTGPIYINLHQFRRVTEKTKDIKTKIKEGDDTLFRLIDIGKNKDIEFDKLSKVLRELQRKFIFIDKKLFELNEQVIL